MDLTTAARIKTQLDKSLTDQDTLIAQVISGVSERAAVEMGRHTESTARTETYNVDDFQTTVALPGFGGALSVSTIHNDSEWTFAASSLVSSSDYIVNVETGVVTFNFTLTRGRQALRVVYTGGMATSAANFITAYPGIAQAVDSQVVFELKRGQNPDVASYSDVSGNVNFVTPFDWLPGVRRVLQAYRLFEGF